MRFYFWIFFYVSHVRDDLFHAPCNPFQNVKFVWPAVTWVSWYQGSFWCHHTTSFPEGLECVFLTHSGILKVALTQSDWRHLTSLDCPGHLMIFMRWVPYAFTLRFELLFYVRQYLFNQRKQKTVPLFSRPWTFCSAGNNSIQWSCVQEALWPFWIFQHPNVTTLVKMWRKLVSVFSEVL